MSEPKRRSSIVIRPAGPTDVAAVVAMETTSIGGHTATGARAVAARFSIPPGDDFFSLVAVDDTGQVLGTVSGGGCRDEDLKGWGELDVFQVTSTCPSGEVGALLLEAAFSLFVAARYEAVTTWVVGDDTATTRWWSSFGFVADGTVRESGPSVSEERRYRRRLEP
jgi:L-amino acid N-acyltransferase YncA